MPTLRRVRQVAGFVGRYFSSNLFKHVDDPRSTRGRRWKSHVPLLTAITVALAAGCKGLGEAEDLTQDLQAPARKLIGIPRRIADTTMRDYLCKLRPDILDKLLRIVAYDAWRRKAFHATFPIAAISMDGKYPSHRDNGEGKHGKSQYLQVHHDEQGNATHGLVRVITSTLVTAEGRPLLGATPVLGDTNEQGSFSKAFGDNVRAYGRLFEMVMYDAGAASEGNADTVIAAGKHYFFQIADPRWIMYQTMELLFAGVNATAIVEEPISKHERIVRHLTILPVKEAGKSLTLWHHTKAILKVYSETYEGDVCVSTKTRYFLTSMPTSRLPPKDWLELVVLRWGVETTHQILDCAFDEDRRPWITSNADGALAVMLLRRVVYTLLTLYKSVTQRSEDNRIVPFRRIMEWLKDTLKWPNAPEFENLRPRIFAVPPVFA